MADKYTKQSGIPSYSTDKYYAITGVERDGNGVSFRVRGEQGPLSSPIHIHREDIPNDLFNYKEGYKKFLVKYDGISGRYSIITNSLSDGSVERKIRSFQKRPRIDEIHDKGAGEVVNGPAFTPSSISLEEQEKKDRRMINAKHYIDPQTEIMVAGKQDGSNIKIKFGDEGHVLLQSEDTFLKVGPRGIESNVGSMRLNAPHSNISWNGVSFTAGAEFKTDAMPGLYPMAMRSIDPSV